MSETFTREELLTAATRLGHQFSMNKLTGGNFSGTLGDQWTAEQLIIRLGYSSEWIREVLEEARRLRLPPIANDDDVLTVGELRAWLERQMGGPLRNDVTMKLRRESIDKLAADIHALREPEYPEGTVVKDATGQEWKRTKSGNWRQRVWSGSIHEDSLPVRPLEVIP